MSTVVELPADLNCGAALIASAGSTLRAEVLAGLNWRRPSIVVVSPLEVPPSVGVLR